MGNKAGKTAPPESPVICDMTRKYREGCLQWYGTWVDLYGFPKEGSLSVKVLSEMRKQMDREERKLREKRTVSVKNLEKYEEMKKCLKMWDEEAERRNRQNRKKRKTNATKNQMKDHATLCILLLQAVGALSSAARLHSPILHHTQPHPNHRCQDHRQTRGFHPCRHHHQKKTRQ